MVPSDLHISSFADDHSIRKSFKANNWHQELEVKEQQGRCMLNIKQWMDQMRLKMNPSKTEYIYFGNIQQLKKCSEHQIDITQWLNSKTTQNMLSGSVDGPVIKF